MREISFDDLPDDLTPKPKFSQPEPTQEVSFDDLPEESNQQNVDSSLIEPKNRGASGNWRTGASGTWDAPPPAMDRTADLRRAVNPEIPTQRPLLQSNPDASSVQLLPESQRVNARKRPEVYIPESQGDLYAKTPSDMISEQGAGFVRGLTAGAVGGPPEPGEEGMIGDLAGSAITNLLPYLAGPGAGIAVNTYYAYIRDLNEQADQGVSLPDMNQKRALARSAVAAAFAKIPGALGTNTVTKAATGATIGSVGNVADVAATQLAETGKIDLEDPNYAAQYKSAAILGAGIGGSVGAVSPSLRRANVDSPIPAPETLAKEIPFDAIPEKAIQAAQAEGKPGIQINPEVPPRERGLFDAAPVPEDMQARQWQAGNEAQTKLLEAEASHDPVKQEHEANLRAAVEAENALRSRFPDEGVSPKFPAERDLLRALTNKYQEAEAKVSETQNRFDETRGALEEAKRLATQAQEVPVPKMSPERLQGRQQVIKAMQDKNMTPEQIQTQIGVMDHLPQLYDGDMRAASLDEPGMMEKLGLGPDVSQETTALRKDGDKKEETLFQPAERAGSMEADTEKASKAWKERGTGSPYFRKWFNKSKVVDDSGKPKIVYHGGAPGIKVFDQSKINSRNEGPGFYFTDDIETASSYQKGGKYEVYLNIENPIDYNAPAFSRAKISKLLEEAIRIESKRNGSDVADGFLSNFGDTRYEGKSKVFKEAVESFLQEEKAVDQISSLYSSGMPLDVIAEALKKTTGHDGFKSEGFGGHNMGGGTIYVPISSEQIKSATGNSGAFDSKNPNILFQQGEKKPAEPFFHQLQRTLEEKMPPRATPEQVRGILKGRVKTEEIEYSGLEEFLSGKEKINKAELLAYLKENEPKIELDVRGAATSNKKVDDLYKKWEEAEKAAESFRRQAYEKYSEKENWPKEVKEEADRLRDAQYDLGAKYSSEKESIVRTKFDKYVEPNGRDYKETLYKNKSKKETDLESEIDKASAEVERRSLKKVNAMAGWKRVSEENGNDGSGPVLEAYRDYQDAKREWGDAILSRDALREKKGKKYQSPHFEEADNTIAHSRSQKFTDENGLNLHHVEEFQSDLHQKGREEGYSENDPEKLSTLQSEADKLKEEFQEAKSRQNKAGRDVQVAIQEAIDPILKGYRVSEFMDLPTTGARIEYTNAKDKNPEIIRLKEVENNLRKEAESIDERLLGAQELLKKQKEGIPDAPFKKSWHEMVIRRELYEAAKNGDDAMTWTGGEKQADRYDLSKQVDNIRWTKLGDGEVEIIVHGRDAGTRLFDKVIKEKDLADHIGKDLAEKILNDQGHTGRLEGDGLKVGGEGMKGFYDKMIPDYLNKYAKKWGVRVETFKTRGDQKAFDAFSSQHKKMYPDATAEEIKKAYGVNTKGSEYQGIRITPEMRHSILEEGQSFFQKNSEEASGRDLGEILGAYIPKSKREKGLVMLFEGANFSTVWHEQIGHSLYHEVIKPDTKLSTEADRLIIRDLGESAIKDGKWTTDAHEWMAKKVEQWAFDGKTNVPTLIPLFKKIMAWMRDVYKDMPGGPTGKELDVEWRQLMDRAFGGEAKGKEGEPTFRESDRPPLSSGTKPQISAKDEGTQKPGLDQGVEPTEHVPGERSLPKTLEKYGVEGGTDREYEVKHLDESAKAAIDEIKEKGAETVQQAILGRAKFDPQDMPRAIALMRQWQYEADSLPPGNAKNTALEKTIQMASEMSKRATEAGQFNAMIRILERLSPDGIVYYAQKQLEKINAKLGPSKHVKMNPETATVLRNAAKELESTRELADQSKSLETVSKKIEKGEQISVDDIAALESFRRKLSVHLGELPPERPKGILGTPGRAKPEPKPASKPTAKPSADNAEAVLEARENAALARLKARGLKPSKALLQSITKLAEEDISDLADVFASRLAKRKASVSAIKENFAEAFGPDVVPHLDEIAQKGARRLQEARREHVKLTELSKRVDEILDPLLKGQPAEIHQAEQLKSAFEALKTLTGDAKREAGWDIQEALGAMVPASFGRKASSILVMAQLLYPKSIIRNLGGNEMFYYAERASKWVAANGIDWTRSKLTGTDRLISFKTGGQNGYFENLMLGTKAAMRGANPEGLESKHDLKGFAFKNNQIGMGIENKAAKHLVNIAANPFYWAEKALGVSFRATDYAAYKRAFNQTLGEIAELSADRKRIPSGQREAYIKKWLEDAPAEVLEIADAYGKYATFQDQTALAKGAMGLKKFLNVGKDFGFGNFIINYPKTPANIMMRAIEYSPIGILKSLHMISEPWRTGLPRNTREVEMSLGRVLVGGAGMGIAWYLANAGVLTGQTDKDRDARNFKKEQTGETNYQVNVSAIGRWLASGLKKDQLNKRDGDELISYDWAQPLAINAAMTATAIQALSDKKNPIEGTAATIEAGIEGATKSLENQPVLQGMEKLFNSDKSIPGRLMEVLEGVPASFFPAIFNGIKQYKDNTARDAQAPTAAARMINKVMYKLPFISEKLPIIYKTLGESEPREMYQNGGNTLFNVFLNPAFTAKYKVDPSIEVILNPYTTEGRKNQFPKSVYERQLKYTEKGEQKSYDLTGAELSELQRRTAQETFTRFKAMEIEKLKDRAPEYQEKVLADGVNDSWNKVRKQFLREKGIHVK